MKKWLCVSAIALTFACKKNEVAQPAPTTAAPTTSTSAAPPADLSKAHVNELITPRPDVVERATLSATLENGVAGGPTTDFKAKQPIHFTMWLKEVPDELQVAARWLDDKGKELSVERRPAKGAKVHTFSYTKALKPGKYKVEGYWGGNVVVEQAFEVK